MSRYDTHVLEGERQIAWVADGWRVIKREGDNRNTFHFVNGNQRGKMTKEIYSPDRKQSYWTFWGMLPIEQVQLIDICRLWQVVGDNPGSKAVEAEKHGVEVINEDDLKALVA